MIKPEELVGKTIISAQLTNHCRMGLVLEFSDGTLAEVRACAYYPDEETYIEILRGGA